MEEFVVCIDNSNIAIRYELILGKVYEKDMKTSEIGRVYVKCEDGAFRGYLDYHFISLSKYRENVINDILI